MNSLQGQTAVITGATGGIGRAVASALVRVGASVILVGRRRPELDALARGIQQGTAVSCATADLEVDAEVRSLARTILESGGVDLLVHGAGTYASGNVETHPVESLDRLYRVNVRAAYLLTQLLLPGLRGRHGQVVFMNSSVVSSSRGQVSQYAMTKHALKALADGLRHEVNAEGVRVLSVYMGRTATPMQREVHVSEGVDYRPLELLQPDDVAEAILSALTLPRTAEVTDIYVRPMRKTSSP